MKVEAMAFRFSKPSSSAPSSPSAETAGTQALWAPRGPPGCLPSEPARPSAVLPTRRPGQRVAEAGDGREGPCGECRLCLGHRPGGGSAPNPAAPDTTQQRRRG